MLTADDLLRFENELDRWATHLNQLPLENRQTSDEFKDRVTFLRGHADEVLTNEDYRNLGAKDLIWLNQNRRLWALHLNNAKLSAVPQSVLNPDFFSHLMGLYLSNNQIEHFSQAGNLPSLRVLYLSNQFPDDPTRGLKTLRLGNNFPLLWGLIFDGNQVEGFDWNAFTGGVPHQLLHIVGSHNKLNETNFKFPAGLLPNLSNVLLNNNEFVEVDLENVPAAQIVRVDHNQRNGTKLKTLKFYRDVNGLNDRVDLIWAVGNNLPFDTFDGLINLSELNISWNDLRGKISLNHLPNLKVFYTAGNPITEIEDVNQLEQLDVNDCKDLASIKWGNSNKLRLLRARETKLSSLDIGAHVDLELLHVRNNPSLERIDIHPDCHFRSIKIDNNPQLTLSKFFVGGKCVLDATVEPRAVSTLGSQKSPTEDIVDREHSIFLNIVKYFPTDARCLAMLKTVEDPRLRAHLIREAAIHFSKNTSASIDRHEPARAVEQAVEGWANEVERKSIEDNEEEKFEEDLQKWVSIERQSPQSPWQGYESEVVRIARECQQESLTWMPLMGLGIATLPSFINHDNFPQLTGLYIPSNEFEELNFDGLSNLRVLMLNGNLKLKPELNLDELGRLQRLYTNFCSVSTIHMRRAKSLLEFQALANRFAEGQVNLGVMPKRFLVPNIDQLQGKITVNGKVYVPNQTPNEELAAYIEGFCAIAGKEVSDESFFSAVRHLVTDKDQQLYLLKTSPRIKRHIEKTPINRDDVEWFVKTTDGAEHRFPHLVLDPETENKFHDLGLLAEHLLDNDEKELEQTRARWEDGKVPNPQDPAWTNLFKHLLEQWVLKGNPHTGQREERLEIQAELLTRWQARATALKNNVPATAIDTRLKWNNRDYEELPEALGMLTWLKELDISNNQLTYLPESFYRLNQLERLNISDNAPLEQLPLRWNPRQISDDNFERARTVFESKTPANFDVLDNVIPRGTSASQVTNAQLTAVIDLFEDRFAHPRELFQAILAFNDPRIDKAALLENSAVITAWLLNEPLPVIAQKDQTTAYQYLQERQKEEADGTVLHRARSREDDLYEVTIGDRDQFARNIQNPDLKVRVNTLSAQSTAFYEEALTNWVRNTPSDPINLRYAHAAAAAILIDCRRRSESVLDLSPEAIRQRIEDGTAKNVLQRVLSKVLGADPAEPSAFRADLPIPPVRFPEIGLKGVSRIKSGDFRGCDFSAVDPNEPDHPLGTKYLGMLQSARKLNFSGTGMTQVPKLHTVPACVVRLDQNPFAPKTRRLIREAQETNWRIDFDWAHQVKLFIEGPLEDWRKQQKLGSDHHYYLTLKACVEHGASSENRSEISSVEDPKLNLQYDGKTRLTALPDELFSMLPSTLTRFDISNHALGGESDPQGSVLDLSELRFATKLRDIDVSGNQYTDIDTRELTPLTDLETFNVESNRLNNVPTGLSVLPSTAELHFAGNPLSATAKNELEQLRLRTAVTIDYDERDKNEFSMMVDQINRDTGHTRQILHRDEDFEETINRVLAPDIQKVSKRMIESSDAAHHYYSQCKKLIYSYFCLTYLQEKPHLKQAESKELLDAIARIGINVGVTAGLGAATMGPGAAMGPLAAAVVTELVKNVGIEVYQIASNTLGTGKRTERGIVEDLKTLINDSHLNPEAIENLSETLAVSSTLMKMDKFEALPSVAVAPVVIPSTATPEKKRFKVSTKWLQKTPLKRFTKASKAKTVVPPAKTTTRAALEKEAADDALSMVTVLTSTKLPVPHDATFESRLRETVLQLCQNQHIPFKPHLFTSVQSATENTNALIKTLFDTEYRLNSKLVKAGIVKRPTGFSGTLDSKPQSTITRSSARSRLERERMQRQFEALMQTVAAQGAEIAILKAAQSSSKITSPADTSLLDPFVKKLRDVALTKSSIDSLEEGGYLTDKVIHYVQKELNDRYNKPQDPHPNKSYFVDPSIAYGIAKNPNFSKANIDEMLAEAKDASLIFFPINNNPDPDKPGGTHWTMVLYDRRNTNKPVFHYYDTLNKEPNWQEGKPLGQVFANAIRPHIDPDNKSNREVQMHKAPEQTLPDCGVLVPSMGEYLANGFRQSATFPIADIKKADIPSPQLKRQQWKTEIATTPGGYVADPWVHEPLAEKNQLTFDLATALKLPVTKVDILTPELTFPGEVIAVKNDVVYFRPFDIKESGDQYQLSDEVRDKRRKVDSDHSGVIDKFPVRGIPISAAERLKTAKVGDIVQVNVTETLVPNQLPTQSISITEVPLIKGFDDQANNQLAKMTLRDRQKFSIMIHQENPGVEEIRLNEWKATRRLDEKPLLNTENEGAVMKPHPEDGRGSKEIPKFYLLTKAQLQVHKQQLQATPPLSSLKKTGPKM